MPDPVPTPAPAAPRAPRALQDQVIQNYLTEAETFLTTASTDPEIRPILEAHGYDDAEFAIGFQLAHDALAAFGGRQTGVGAQSQATGNLQTAIAGAREDYIAFREIAPRHFPRTGRPPHPRPHRPGPRGFPEIRHPRPHQLRQRRQAPAVRAARPRIGLNTGCGDRWTTRLWSTEKWIELITGLQAAGYTPVLLGGEAEDARNRALHAATGAAYLGTFSLPQFINLMNQMDGIVTQVTMGMHISIALRKPTILMNNIFNPHEFDLYGRGQIVQPNKDCVCFYRGSCQLGTSCMEDLPAAKVLAAVRESVAV